MKKLSKKEKIISWIIITFFVLIIIGALSDDKRSNNLDQETIKPKIEVIKKEKNKDQILKDFLKNELNKEVDLNKQEVKLSVVTELNENGKINKLKKDFPVNIFKTIESDITKLAGKLKPGDKIELIDYINKGRDEFGSYSRCKVKNGALEGWFSCGWIKADISNKQ